MSCVRESSPLQDFDSDNEKNVVTSNKRRFWNPKKWFRRKSSKVSNESAAVETVETGKDALRSRSTSELSVVDEGRRRSSSSMHLGLSVSHDSVFHSPNSGSDIELDAAQSSSSLSACQPHMDCRLQTELNARLRLRRGREDNSEDDEGFPYSSCNSPTTSDGLLLDKTANKDLPAKSHSTCSDGSLLSMDSYEMDEDLSDPQSRYSSKLSLQEKKSNSDSLLEFGLKSNVAPLNHSAAHHRVAVKPKRTHGVPRRKKGQQLSSALPVTPEVNEDSSIRSVSPEGGPGVYKDVSVDTDTLLSATVTHLTEAQVKCSSLPPNIKGATDVINLNRSLSSAGSHDETQPRSNNEKTEEKLSLFDRIFPRKSNRKKKDKAKEDQETVKQEGDYKETNDNRGEITDVTQTTSETSVKTQSSHSFMISSSKQEVPHFTAAHGSASASRQRLPPIDIPLSPSYTKKDFVHQKVVSENMSINNVQFQTELESRFKQKQTPFSSSPPMTLYPNPSDTSHPLERSKPPLSPRSTTAVILSKSEDSSHQITTISSSSTRVSEMKSRNEELRSKMKLPGLSSLQQRVLSLNDDVDAGFKSLTDFPIEIGRISKPLAKSQSFKSNKESTTEVHRNNLKRTAQFLDEERKETTKSSFTKAVSLDSVKNLEEKAEFKRPKRDVSDEKSEIEESSEGYKVFSDSSITISGPSHTAVVNVTNDNKEEFIMNRKVVEDHANFVSVKEHAVSVTKIHLKQEAQISQTTNSESKSTIPEFINKQLNKVEPLPASNIILSIKSPKVAEDHKSIFNFDVVPETVNKPQSTRKFSKEDVEIIEKNDISPKPVISEANINLQPKFKKNDKPFRKSSVTSTLDFLTNEKNGLKHKSASLDSLKSESDKSSQNSLDRLEKDRTVISDPVVLRKKSIASKKEEEPELMKVFARRSLKLKDSDVDSLQESLSDAKTRDSDKENQASSPVEVHKDCFKKPAPDEKEVPRRSIIRAASLEEKNSTKDPLVEIKLTNESENKEKETSAQVPYRKMLSSNPFLGQRAMSVSTPRAETTVKKQLSLSERRKTDQWITKPKDQEEREDKISDVKKDLTAESNNFSQRKAEWEKRAQLAQLKKSP